MLSGYPVYITIEGHTDNIPINTPEFPDNTELSYRQAMFVYEVFVLHCGVDPSRVDAFGLADYYPLASNDTSEGRALNRRIVINVTYIYETL